VLLERDLAIFVRDELLCGHGAQQTAGVSLLPPALRDLAHAFAGAVEKSAGPGVRLVLGGERGHNLPVCPKTLQVAA